MVDIVPDSSSLRPQELEAIYSISRVVAQEIETDDALDEVIKIARPVFIFDNMVLYIRGEDEEYLEVKYARAIGRGRSTEDEMTWGESAAKAVFESGNKLLHIEDSDDSKDRLDEQHFLGLPLRSGGQTMGSLVFIRFGGPPYTDDQIHLAEYITAHIASLLDRQRLVERVASLEADRRLARLQEDFMATISHELHTPLGFIKGYATTLLREDTEWDEETRREFLTIIDEEADRFGEIIDRLLDSSRLQSGVVRMNIQPVNADEFFTRLTNMANSRYNNLTIDLTIDSSISTVYLDTDQFRRVFDNMFNNASKYAPGSVVEILIKAQDNRIHIQIKDNGPGIPEQHLSSLFNRFYRVPGANPGVRGTGLGLFICRQIVTAHGGEISVESAEGKGTTFNILLPSNFSLINNQEASDDN